MRDNVDDRDDDVPQRKKTNERSYSPTYAPHDGHKEDRQSNYKRGYDDRRNRNFKDIIEIDSHHVGGIIGRGGSNIKDLQGQYSVRVNVDKDCNSNGKIDVSVSGESQSNVDDAIRQIRNQIADLQQRHGQRDRSGGNYRSSNSNRTGRDYGNSSYQQNNYQGRSEGGYRQSRRSPTPE